MLLHTVHMVRTRVYARTKITVASHCPPRTVANDTRSHGVLVPDAGGTRGGTWPYVSDASPGPRHAVQQAGLRAPHRVARRWPLLWGTVRWN